MDYRTTDGWASWVLEWLFQNIFVTQESERADFGSGESYKNMNQNEDSAKVLTVFEFDAAVSTDVEGLFSIFQEWNWEYNFDFGFFGLSFRQLRANNSSVFIDGECVL